MSQEGSPGEELETGTVDVIAAPIEIVKKTIHTIVAGFKAIIEGTEFTTGDILQKISCIATNPLTFLSCF